MDPPRMAALRLTCGISHNAAADAATITTPETTIDMTSGMTDGGLIATYSIARRSLPWRLT